MIKKGFEKKNQTLKKIKQLTDIEKSYLAGFIDGEASIDAKIIRANDLVHKFALSVGVSITQKPEKRWFLISLQKKLGCGSINSITEDSSEKKSIDNFILNSMPLVRHLLLELQPYLKLKKPQAKLAIKIIDRYWKRNFLSKLEFINLCKIIDRLTELNNSKKYLKKNSITGTTVEKELLADDPDPTVF